MRPLWLVALVLLLPLTARAEDAFARFGPRIVPIAGAAAPVATGDFDGDGKPDLVYLVAVKPAAPGAALPKDVTVQPNLFGHGPLGNRGAKRALAIVQGNGALFLLTGLSGGGDFFDTPIWESGTPPVRTAARGSKDFAETRKHEKRIRSDIILVGTEAGIEEALWWNGKAWALYQPADEP